MRALDLRAVEEAQHRSRRAPRRADSSAEIGNHPSQSRARRTRFACHTRARRESVESSSSVETPRRIWEKVRYASDTMKNEVHARRSRVIKESAALGCVVERPAERVHDFARSVQREIDLPDFLETDSKVLRVRVRPQRETLLETTPEVAAQPSASTTQRARSSWPGWKAGLCEPSRATPKSPVTTPATRPSSIKRSTTTNPGSTLIPTPRPAPRARRKDRRGSRCGCRGCARGAARAARHREPGRRASQPVEPLPSQPVLQAADCARRSIQEPPRGRAARRRRPKRCVRRLQRLSRRRKRKARGFQCGQS